MNKFRIPFNKPGVSGAELEHVAKAIEGGHFAGDGAFTRGCQTLLERELGVQKALLTTSGTHALELSCLLLDIRPGDEVIVPSFTFVSTVNAFVIRGATPVFADIRPDTLNLDEVKLPALLTSRTRAIVPVHYAGVGCEMDAIQRVASAPKVAIVEDNSHGLFAKYRGRPLGTFGCLSVQSFHETKNLHCGEGGALLINDAELAKRAEILREKGTNRSAFIRGEVDKYTWVDVGSSYLPSDLLAAFLYGQLEARDKIQARRRQIWERYHRQLQGWAEEHQVGLPTVPAHCEQPYHLFYLLLPSSELRNDLIDHLKQRGIQSVFHYLPLHLSPMGKKFGGQTGDCPVTESVSGRLVRLPFHNTMTESEQAEVIAAVEEFPILQRLHTGCRSASP